MKERIRSDRPKSATLQKALDLVAGGVSVADAARQVGLAQQTVQKGWLRWVVEPEWRAFQNIPDASRAFADLDAVVRAAVSDVARTVATEAKRIFSAQLAELNRMRVRSAPLPLPPPLPPPPPPPPVDEEVRRLRAQVSELQAHIAQLESGGQVHAHEEGAAPPSEGGGRDPGVVADSQAGSERS